MPTRYSLFLISVGTPIRMVVSLPSAEDSARGARQRGDSTTADGRSQTAEKRFFCDLPSAICDLPSGQCRALRRLYGGGVGGGTPNRSGATQCAAASASTMPDDVSWSQPSSPVSRAVRRRTFITSHGVSVSSSASIIAAALATCGVAIDVPLSFP